MLADDADAVGEPAEPDGMGTEEIADFGAFAIGAFAAGEAEDFAGGFRGGFGEMPAFRFRAEALQEVDEDGEIGVHTKLNDRFGGLPKKSAKMGRESFFGFFGKNGKWVI